MSGETFGLITDIRRESLKLPRVLGPRAWMAQRPRIEPNINGEKINVMMPKDIMLYS